MFDAVLIMIFAVIEADCFMSNILSVARTWFAVRAMSFAVVRNKSSPLRNGNNLHLPHKNMISYSAREVIFATLSTSRHRVIIFTSTANEWFLIRFELTEALWVMGMFFISIAKA